MDDRQTKADNEPLSDAELKLAGMLDGYLSELADGSGAPPSDVPTGEVDPELLSEFEQGRRVIERLARNRDEFCGPWLPEDVSLAPSDGSLADEKTRRFAGHVSAASRRTADESWCQSGTVK